MKLQVDFKSFKINKDAGRDAMKREFLGFVLQAKNHVVNWKLSGHPVRRRTGTLARSIQERKINDFEYELGSYGVAYAARLNYGSDRKRYNYWLESGVVEAFQKKDIVAEEKAKNIIKDLLGRDV